jgi:transmembrane sensor
MLSKSISPELIDKYLAGECTVAENRKIESWYAAQGEEKDYLSTLSDLDKHLLEEATLEKIKSAIGIPFESQEEAPRKISFWRNSRFQMGIAASMLLVCLSAWVYFQNKTGSKTDDIFAGITKEIPTNSVIRFVNEEAKLVKHSLPDGTEVCLHPNAELTYPKAFTGETRQVTFIGEGFFDVAHDANHPFLIQSEKMQIRVLGTKFNVKALPKQAIFQVAVLSGSVAVRSMTNQGKANPETIILKPQQKALFEVATNQLTALTTNSEARKEIFEPISINFNDTKISEVVKQLERQFNIHIQLSDNSISKCLLTADFNNQSLPVILDILCTSLDVTYTLSGDTLILKGAGCE